ncbi:unnamed protein product [Ectocarpus sp. 13 AM-2016]
MENASYAKVRLESAPYSTRFGIGILSAVYVIGLLACLIVGTIKGPNVFERSPPAAVETNNLNVTWYGKIDGMERWHQVLYLHMRLNKPDMISGAVSYEQRYSVSSWASEEPVDDIACPDGCTSECNVGGQCVELAQGIVTDRVIQCPSNEQWCGWTTLLTEEFVEFGTYYMQVDMEQPQIFSNAPEFTLDFEIVYITKEFTTYQMYWHYAWILITLVFMFVPKIGFFYEMMQLHQNFWSRQQARVGVLLLSLLFFNNVFFGFQIFSPFPRFFFSLYIIFVATFLALMLFFWLELFGDLAAGNMQGTDTALEWERNRKKTVLEYLPKLVLVGLIWIVTVLTYIYVRVQQTGDPSYSTFDDLSTYTGVKVVGLLLATLYFLWLGSLVFRSFTHIESMNSEYIFIMVITLVTIVGTMSAVYTGALAPDQHGSKVFAYFYGMFNIYVLLLAFCYTPAGSIYGDINTNDNLEMVAETGTVPSAGDDTAFTIVESNNQHTML